MPKYFCDYCDTHLTHDSPSVRKTHNSGRKHKEAVKLYYVNWLEHEAQNMMSHQGGFPPRPGFVMPMPGMMPPGLMPGPMPPPPMGMPPGMMPPPGMMGPPPGMHPPPPGPGGPIGPRGPMAPPGPPPRQQPPPNK